MTNIVSKLSYFAVIMAILTFQTIMFTISPGNLVVALLPSIVAISILVPGSNDIEKKRHQMVKVRSNTLKEVKKVKEKEPLTFSDIADSLNQPIEEELTLEELAVNSMIGNVFDTMEKNAKQDIYSNSISTTTENPLELEEEEIKQLDDCNVKLDVDNDGKLHYIFLDDEDDAIDENIPFDDDEDLDIVEEDDKNQIGSWFNEMVNDVTEKLKTITNCSDVCSESIKMEIENFLGEKVQRILSYDNSTRDRILRAERIIEQED